MPNPQSNTEAHAPDRKVLAESAGSARCTCRVHPRYGVEIDHSCDLHGERCEHGKKPDEYCAACDAEIPKGELLTDEEGQAEIEKARIRAYAEGE